MSRQSMLVLTWLRECDYSDTFYRGYINGFINAIKWGDMPGWEAAYLTNIVNQLNQGVKA
jgi:hypothetical protein